MGGKKFSNYFSWFPVYAAYLKSVDEDLDSFSIAIKQKVVFKNRFHEYCMSGSKCCKSTIDIWCLASFDLQDLDFCVRWNSFNIEKVSLPEFLTRMQIVEG